MLKKEHKDIISSIFFIILAIAIYVTSFSIKVTSAESLGPQFFPKVVAIAMVILSTMLLINSLRALKKASDGDSKKGVVEFNINWPLIFTSILLLFYMMFVSKLGFVVISIIYLFFQIMIITPKENWNKKNVFLIAIISIVAPIILYELFYNAFNIFLPMGIMG